MTAGGPNRTAVLAASAAALGAIALGAFWWQGREGPGLDCPPDQVRVGADGVASCGPGKEPSAPAKLTLGAKLDLNRASAEDLAAIDGVGPVLARAIIDARTALGGFKGWDDLDSVPGVGPARLETLKAVGTLDSR
jgi:competence protein ComEA